MLKYGCHGTAVDCIIDGLDADIVSPVWEGGLEWGHAGARPELMPVDKAWEWVRKWHDIAGAY